MNACPNFPSCTFVPTHSDRPGSATDEVIAEMRYFDTVLEADQIAAYAEAIAQTRVRCVDGMACTKCGKIIPRDPPPADPD